MGTLWICHASLAAKEPSNSEFIKALVTGEIPRASARAGFPLKEAKSVSPKNQAYLSLGTVARDLRKALSSAGFAQQGWYLIDDSGNREPICLAVLTQVEQFNENGVSTNSSKRWTLDYTGPDIDSLRSFIKTLLKGASPGHYRGFLIQLRKAVLHNPTVYAPMAEERLRDWMTSGSRSLDFDVLDQVPAEGYDVVVYIYEFQKSPTSGEVKFIDGSTTQVPDHLKGAGLWPFFQRLGF